MSSTTIVCIQLIILFSNINSRGRIFATSQCDLLSAISLQSATYIHSVILRVQPIDSSSLTRTDQRINRSVLRKMLVREVIKIPIVDQYALKINNIIIIRITDYDQKNLLDDSCWHLLRISSVDIIIFLNETYTNEFDLFYPPVESTLRVRQHIDTVLQHETYSPQVLIKTRLDNALVSKDYSLQCNSRGNPVPRLLWSKRSDRRNETLEYYPVSKQCKTTCRIYSIQNKYQSILYFQSLTLDDIGIYVCHAENPMNQTTTSIYLNINAIDYQSGVNQTMSCASLKNCNNRGECLSIGNQLKCFCESGYFGEQCETHYGDIVKKQDTAILLFKSRFLAGCILAFVGFLLVLIALLSWFLARNNRQQRRKFKVKSSTKPAVEKPLISPVKEIVSLTETKATIPSSPIKQITKSSSSPSSLPSTTIHITHSPMIEKKPLPPTPPPPSHRISRTITRESSTATTDEDDEDEGGINSFLRHYQTLPPVPTKIDEEYEERFSLKMNKSEEHGLGCLTNGIHPHDITTAHSYVVDFYQPDHRTGLIKPLHMREDPPQRYTKYVSSYSKFVLPRPVKSSSSDYQQ